MEKCLLSLCLPTGEPSGTGGRPILIQIDGHCLTHCLVVVTRYFGGTKLGTGGLTRAYGGTAGAALDSAHVERTYIRDTLTLSLPFDLEGLVRSEVGSFNGVVQEVKHEDKVTMSVAVPTARVADLCQRLADRSSGRVHVAL